jgi:Zn-dependent peptidase ImmA (M78 family)
VQRLVEDKLGVLVTKHAFSDGRLRGVAVRSSKGRLAAVSNRLPTGLLRVTIAHELCHHVCDLEPNDTISESNDETREGFEGSDPSVEQRAKAFAVMFLAPSTIVRELFGPPNHQFTTAAKALDAAGRLGARCGISTTASVWHLFHLKYLVDVEHDVQVWQRQVKEAALSDFEQTSGSSDGFLRAVDAALAADEIETDHADWLRRL